MFKRALKAGPTDARTLELYADFLAGTRHDPDSADRFFRKAIAAAPDDGHSSRAYGDFLEMRRHDFDKAEEYIKRGVELDIENACALNTYGRFLQVRRHDFDRAESYYRRAVAAKPPHPNHFQSYALLLEGVRHDVEGAERYYELADANYQREIEADRSRVDWLVTYAGFLLGRGRTDEGLRRLSEADQSGPRPSEGVVLAFLRFAQDCEPSHRAAALSTLRSKLGDGVRADGYLLDGNVWEAKRTGHPDAELIAVLADVISNGEDVSKLARFPVWTATAS